MKCNKTILILENSRWPINLSCYIDELLHITNHGNTPYPNNKWFIFLNQTRHMLGEPSKWHNHDQMQENLHRRTS
jgi:hypothetical protein